MKIWKTKRKRFLNYLNKIFVVLLVLCLCSCSFNNNKNNEDEITNNIEYIEPMREVFIFDELDETLQTRIKKANSDIDYQNYQFHMLFSKAYEKDLKDINDNTINLNDYSHLIFEVVSVDCNHCKKIAKESLEQFVKAYPEYTFIQYFDDGTTEEIYEFYKSQEMEVPDYVTILPKDEELHRYIYDEVGMKQYPTLNFYLDNELSYSVVGEISFDGYKNAIDLAFNNPITNDDLIKEDGTSLLNLDRSYLDVKHSLSEENIQKIENLSSDLYTTELTYKLMGSHLDYDDIKDGSQIYISEIENFEEYKNENVVLLYTLLEDVSQTDRIDFINELIKSNDSVKYIVVFIESYSSSSNIYQKMNYKIEGAPIVSILGNMPYDFYNYGIVAFPSAIFVEKSTFTGAFSKIEDVETFNYAIDMFIGDNSIAHKDNN